MFLSHFHKTAAKGSSRLDLDLLRRRLKELREDLDQKLASLGITREQIQDLDRWDLSVEERKQISQELEKVDRQLLSIDHQFCDTELTRQHRRELLACEQERWLQV